MVKVLFIVCCILRLSVFKFCNSRKELNGFNAGLKLCSFFICVWMVKVMLLNGLFMLKILLKIRLW